MHSLLKLHLSPLKKHLTAFIWHDMIHPHFIFTSWCPQSKVKSDGFSLPIYYVNMFSSMMLLRCSKVPFLSSKVFGEGVLEQNFLLSFTFFCLLLFISAASDHYLIGNNITVAVLGIVIPIGEYSSLSRCCLCFLPACFSLLASPSLLVAQVLHVVYGRGILSV